VGISPSRENQSGFLVQEADSVRELSLAEVSSFLGRADRQSDFPVPAGAARRAEVPLEAAAQRVARSVTDQRRRDDERAWV